MTAKIKTVGKSSRHRHPTKPRGISDKAFRKVYWPYIPVVLIIGVLLTFGSQAGALSAIIRHPNGKVLSYATSMSIGGLLADTNVARSQNGVAGLNLNDKLDAAAQAKANDMATRNYWSHNTPEGNPPWVFVNAQGYSYQKLGENLAAGFNDEQSTINGWMASPPHRENLLDPAFSDVGFGFANNPNYTSAGGGPMTIVVAFYGQPQVLAAHSSAPAATATPTPPPAQSPAPAPAPTPQPTPVAPPPTPVAKTVNKTPPATTQSAIKSDTLSAKSSRAQLVLAGLPIASFATSLAVLGALTAIGVWISRHALAARRAFAYGEAFAIRHPLMDIGLLVIAALSFLLSQTAGLIQ
ncbi:MAG TPA: CAP domain-containing protein [Candidatus Saccharimonadales bacterium]|nr:CAP domain-containing protein [Candidatus Saccharimonadales bacterium]